MECQILSLQKILGFDEAQLTNYDQSVVNNKSEQLLTKLNQTININSKEKESMNEMILMARNILSDDRKKETYMLVSSIVKAEQSLLKYFIDNQQEYLSILKKIEGQNKQIENQQSSKNEKSLSKDEKRKQTQHKMNSSLDQDLQNLDPQDFNRFPELFVVDGPGKTYKQKSAAKNYKGVTGLSEQNLSALFKEYQFTEQQKNVCNKIKQVLDHLINEEERGIVQQSQDKKLFTCFNVLNVAQNQIQTKIIKNTINLLQQFSSSSLDQQSKQQIQEIQLAYATLIDSQKFKVYKFINEVIEESPSLNVYYSNNRDELLQQIYAINSDINFDSFDIQNDIQKQKKKHNLMTELMGQSGDGFKLYILIGILIASGYILLFNRMKKERSAKEREKQKQQENERSQEVQQLKE
ncbi:UNKNOWN [Stylonychia lemnae]|uniref:Transmembrane protein n=1 Tax=Stylonychia lemnae TaxID=5949 RepID=A0A078B8K5_STYLE|nr:UNKNOWN [Stylonychia lemnae]|eukprot:CDW90531.1 UNKNOWN [Stylonychia lemnae]